MYLAGGLRSLPPVVCLKCGWQLTIFIFHTGAANLILKFEKQLTGFTPAGRCWAPGLRSLPGAVFVQLLVGSLLQIVTLQALPTCN